MCIVFSLFTEQNTRNSFHKIFFLPQFLYWWSSQDTLLHQHQWQLNLAYTVQCRYNAVNFIQIQHKKHLIACPWGRDMGVSFVNITFDACFAPVTVVPDTKSCHVGSRYNGTRLYAKLWLDHYISYETSHILQNLNHGLIHCLWNGHQMFVLWNF